MLVDDGLAPGIIQIITADNDCDEAGPGDNLADCGLLGVDNEDIEMITQDNEVTGADDATTVSQDNGVSIIETITVENDCDETSTTMEIISRLSTRCRIGE